LPQLLSVRAGRATLAGSAGSVAVHQAGQLVVHDGDGREHPAAAAKTLRQQPRKTNAAADAARGDAGSARYPPTRCFSASVDAV